MPTFRLLSPQLRLALLLAALLWATGMLARLAFGAWFTAHGSRLPIDAWGAALLLGARFDARVALVSVALAWLMASLPWLGPRLRPPLRRGLWRGYWLVAGAVWAVGLIFDAGHYAYLTQRLSAVLFTLARDAREATGMVWQTYPVLWIGAALALWLWVWDRAFKPAWSWAVQGGDVPRRWPARLAAAAVVGLAAGIVHGKLSQYPLRWSDSAELPTVFAQQLALNPLHNLYDTWTFRESGIDEVRLRPAANRIRAFVGLPALQGNEPISLLRTIDPVPAAAKAAPPNVVLVLLESFAGHKVGALGSPLGATPSFDALARDGLLFTRMMSAHAHTARGVFATVTAIPDVSRESTASRNPAAANQFSIVSEFRPHKKFYFIGGSTSWANVRGLLASNIPGIEIVEQTRLKSPVVDVWGVSDKNLFLEANDWLKAQTQPFFAIVQTSGNHRPYTIPAEDAKVFDPPIPSAQALQDHGFISPEEYRAFAYLDWCVGQFMERARREKYFENTIFAFVGDHGISGVTGPHFPPAWRELVITQGHTPLLIYAPGRVAPKRIEHWAQQVDVLPTLAGLAGIGYRNTTLGRDLLDPRFDATRIAFTFQFGGAGQLGVLVGNYMLVDGEPTAIYDITATQPRRNLLEQAAVPPAAAEVAKQWSGFPRDYDLIARYLQTHNKRLDAAP
jgi:glucan phosphoethanolaminetransferase (alkaline phosphatase superfamily)